ncbi:MAG: HAD family hydrolase [Anaerolineae bacterium]|nr:HAD family hydrolase [Anaerolineae bacterium]
MLEIAGQRISPRLIVLDKDGTLIAFDAMWHAWFEKIIHEIQTQLALKEETWQALAGTLGFDPHSGEWDPKGPLTMAATSEVALLLASQIYRYEGKDWEEALEIVAQAEQRARAQLLEEDLIQPIGDIQGTLGRLRDAGILLALATTDDRKPTERTLKKLGIAPLFATIVCGDDGIPLKPAPDMAQEICQRLGIPPEEAMMVGDTTADLIMAREAGYRYTVGVTSGAHSAEMLAPYADWVVPNIHAIHVLKQGEKAK